MVERPRVAGPAVRLRIIRPISGSIDGIDLNHFEVGSVYDVGTRLGSYLLAMGWPNLTRRESCSASNVATSRSRVLTGWP